MVTRMTTQNDNTDTTLPKSPLLYCIEYISAQDHTTGSTNRVTFPNIMCSHKRATRAFFSPPASPNPFPAPLPCVSLKITYMRMNLISPTGRRHMRSNDASNWGVSKNWKPLCDQLMSHKANNVLKKIWLMVLRHCRSPTRPPLMLFLNILYSTSSCSTLHVNSSCRTSSCTPHERRFWHGNPPDPHHCSVDQMYLEVLSYIFRMYYLRSIFFPSSSCLRLRHWHPLYHQPFRITTDKHRCAMQCVRFLFRHPLQVLSFLHHRLLPEDTRNITLFLLVDALAYLTVGSSVISLPIIPIINLGWIGHMFKAWHLAQVEVARNPIRHSVRLQVSTRDLRWRVFFGLLETPEMRTYLGMSKMQYSSTIISRICYPQNIMQ